MNKTVIGAFEIRTEALQAKQDLLAAGFAESAIRLHYRNETGRNDSDPGTDSPNDNPGFMEAIRSLFTWDLDHYRDEDYAEHYAEAANRGHVILSISVDESEVERVSDIMDSAGALDIDEKVAEWRTQGYSGGRQRRANDPGNSLNTWAGSDPAAGAVAGNAADSGLDRTIPAGTSSAAGAGEPTTGGSIGSGVFDGDMDQGSVPGIDEQGASAPPARRNVRIVPSGSPAGNP